MGVGLIGSLTVRYKINQTRNALDADTAALISYAASRRCLVTSDNFSNVAKTPRDAWNKNILYIPAEELVPNQCVPFKTDICSRMKTNLTLKICNDASCSSPTVIHNLAFAVISGGANYNIQSGIGGTEVRIYSPGIKNIDDYPNDTLRPEDYDDIARWATLDELRNKAGCSGPALKILNTSLPEAIEEEDYSATIYASGGVPFQDKYKWCVEGTLPDGMNVDPSSAKSSNCASYPLWPEADKLTLGGKPEKPGSYKITVWVKDAQGAAYSRDFVITVHPKSNGDNGGNNNNGNDQDDDQDQDDDRKSGHGNRKGNHGRRRGKKHH